MWTRARDEFANVSAPEARAAAYFDRTSATSDSGISYESRNQSLPNVEVHLSVVGGGMRKGGWWRDHAARALRVPQVTSPSDHVSRALTRRISHNYCIDIEHPASKLAHILPAEGRRVKQSFCAARGAVAAQTSLDPRRAPHVLYMLCDLVATQTPRRILVLSLASS